MVQAQRRFRKRQKERLEEISKEVEALTIEKEAVALGNKELSKAVSACWEWGFVVVVVVVATR